MRALHVWRGNGSIHSTGNNNSKNKNTKNQKQKRQVERLDKLLPLPMSLPCIDAISNFSLTVDETQMKAVDLFFHTVLFISHYFAE